MLGQKKFEIFKGVRMNKRNQIIESWGIKTIAVFISSLIMGHAQAAGQINDQLIIKLHDSFSSQKAAKAQLLRKFAQKAVVLDEMNLLAGTYLVVSPKNLAKSSKQKWIEEISSWNEVEYVEKNQEIHLIASEEKEKISLPIEVDPSRPADPKFNVLWGLLNTGKNIPDQSGNASEDIGVAGSDIDALNAWEINSGSRKVKIAVIDTGIDFNHPDLIENMWTNEAEANGKAGEDDDNNGIIDDIHGANFVNASSPTGNSLDDHNHGTHCAGTIAALHNDQGVAGVMKEATLVGVKFLSASGSGSLDGAMKAIDYATRLKVNVMSNSWGGGGFNQGLFDVIKKASDEGIIFVAAAGNSSSDTDKRDFYPANYKADSVISIAASTAQDKLASFSNYGAKNVLIAAPGHKILSTVKGGNYAVFSGTSMATPHVSGIIGLMLSAKPKLKANEIKDILVSTAVKVDSFDGKVVANGRVNAFEALKEATNK